jgi:hypothetical protein
MITDQNVALTSRRPITVRVQRDAAKYRAATALSDGDGTRERPLHFVLLACHADMADEAPSDVIERNTSVLAEEVLVRLQNEQSDVRHVLQMSNAAAAATNRYYSIVAGRVTQRNVSVGAIGSVAGILAEGNVRTPIITPNVLRVGEHAILNGTFGIGFKEEAVTANQFNLDNDATLLLIIGDEAEAIGSTAEHRDAESFIERIVLAARTSPPIVAVVR